MTNHARDRALERGINISDIERIVNDPIETIQDPYHGNYKSFGLVEGSESCYIKIIHSESDISAQQVYIVSVMMTDRGGIKADGFSKI